MSFRLPKKIEHAGHTCRVLLVTKVDADDSMGEYNDVRKTIRLKRGLDSKSLEWAFWHEYFHFFLDVNGVARDDVGIPGLAEEMLCDRFADAMTADKIVRFKRRGKK